ncbi:hypothetical protein LZF95_21415 [Algoriphagus sp. AGSA1]|uniref:beta strand repeat-containing protein n=1 Tax=Algoriphagus sp. AGSA1 TaxID=2907213 RepID=UPI001F296A32|nr:PKD-like domain-containing protein [Algoriphagus sp. AGSA1]MCE7057254.1 hypothetical protein [Algoriphagus sp. AGSA1]
MVNQVLLGFLFIALTLVGGKSYGQTQMITTAGPGTFTVPAGATSIMVEVWAAGGQGGSRSGSNGVAGGGGGGAYSRSVLTVTPGQSINFYVGFGARASAVDPTTDPGEDSWFLGNTTVMAKGGNSVGRNITTGATGGSGTDGYGDVKFSGGSGANASGNNAGGGGSSAAIAANGNNATNQTGGTATTGGGDGGDGKTGEQGRGEDGFLPGGGGGGSKRTSASGTEQIGGYGGNGQIHISYIALTSVTGTDNQSVCEYGQITEITYSFPAGSTVSINNLPTGLTSNVNSAAGTLSISGIPTSDGIYTINVTPSYLSSIPVILTQSGSVTIIPRPDVSDITETVCSEDTFTITPIDGVNGFIPAGTTYSWTPPSVTGGLTGGESGSDNDDITGALTNPTNTPETATYTVTPTYSGCDGSSFDVVVTINPNATINDQTLYVCSGDLFSISPANGTDGIVPPGTTYDWELTSVTGGLTGGVDGSGSTIAGYLTNTTNSLQTATYTVTPTSGTCTGSDFTVTINVNPTNTATPIRSENQSQCINEALVDITFNTTGATGISNDGIDGANGLPPGVSASWDDGVITISGTPTSTAESPYNYSIPLTGGCGNIEATGTITVTPDNTVSANTAMDQTLCINTPLTAISFTTAGANGIANDGVSGANGLPLGLSATWSGNTITISGSPSEHVNSPYNYSIPLIGGCEDLFAEGTISVNPASEITAEDMDDQRICEGNTFSEISIIATGTGALSYQWFSNDTPDKTGATPVGANSPSLTPPADAIGTTYYYVEVTSDCGSIATSRFMQATVEPITTITTDIDNLDDVECFGDGFDPLTVVAEGADLTYQWYVNTDQQNTGGTLINGAISATYTPPSTDIGSLLYYYVVVSGYCTSDTSIISGQYRVNPPETVIDQNPDSNDFIVCPGDAFPELKVLASGEGTITYQWYSNNSPQNTGGTLINGATDPTFTPPNNTVGTKYYYATGRSNCGTVPTAVSGGFTVTQPSVVTSEDLNGQEICVDDSFSPISITADGTGTIEYQWYSNTSAVADTLGAEVIELTGENSNSFTPPTTLGTLYYFIKVSSECGENAVSNPSGAFTVNPFPIPILTSDVDGDPEVCEGTTVTYTTEPDQTNYIWDIPGQVVNTDYSINSGGTTSSNTISITWLTDGTKDVAVYYTDPNGCTADAPANNTITVDPLPDPTLTSTIDADPFICEGGSVTYTTESGQTDYIWSFPGQVENTDYTLTAGGTNTSNTATVTWLTDGQKDVTISYTDSNGCSPFIPTTNSITIDPLPIPTFTSSPGLDVCAEVDEITYTTQAGQSNYIWSITGTEGADYEITAGGIGSSDSSVSIIWLTGGPKTVEVSYTHGTTGCAAASTATSVTEVEALPEVGLPDAPNNFPSVCSSEPNLTPFSQPTTGVTGINQDGVPGVNGLPVGVYATFNSSTGEIEFSGNVAGATPGLYNYSIPLLGNCINGLEATGTIDVTPTYELTSVSSASATVNGGSASITINGNLATLPDGEYEITYILDDGINPLQELTSTSFFINNGRGTFPTAPLDIDDVDVYTLTIKNIKKATDFCTIDLDVEDPNNTTYFSVCGAPFNTDGTFYVPAGIYEITIQASAAGATGETGTITIPVRPGQTLGVFVGQSGTTGSDRDTWVTLDSSLPDPENSSLIHLVGTGGAGNGQVLISYTCPDPNDSDCIEVIDDGGISGTTIIRFTCDYEWQIPEGIVDFSVYAIGQGGGGGMGNTGGGGGGGGFASTTVVSTAPFGIPAGNSLDIQVGREGGQGAETVNVTGKDGENSTVTSTIPDPSSDINVNLIAQGGGGGGSFNNLNGRDGASGGGGAFSDQARDIQGMGGSSTGQGNNGGNGGRGNGVNTARAGGGGGGAGSVGEIGSGAGVGNAKAGAGGKGESFILNTSIYGYGAGGGGVGFNSNSTPREGGLGGEVNGLILGGTGIENGIGLDGTIYTGSGGGAGTLGGGNGGQGVVYITYFNYRILEVEYLYFNATYTKETHSGELTWATAKEWENDRFEIERVVGNDLSKWTNIGEVKGNGYTDSPAYYSFTDTDLPAVGGNVFYRLKQVNYDESYTYSITRAIQVPGLKGYSKWIAYPNPSSPGTYVKVELLDKSGYKDGKVIVQLSNVSGVAYSYTVNSVEDVSEVVNQYLLQAAPGVHIVQLIWGNQSEHLKILRR